MAGTNFELVIISLILVFNIHLSLCESQEVAPTNAPGEFSSYTQQGFSIPDFSGTYGIPGIVELSYSLKSNRVIDLKLNVGTLKNDKESGFVKLNTIDAGGFIIGQFGTEMEITGNDFEATININGGYTLNITDMVMNQTLEILPGLKLLLRECSVDAESVVLKIVDTEQDLPDVFLESLFSWLSRALKDDLEDVVCLAAEAETKKGIDSAIIRSILFNANVAKQQGSDVLNFPPTQPKTI
ncbi:uncharacterized protein LOC120326202 [Styela clava]